MFGNQNGNAGSGNNCLTFANVGSGSACLTLIAQFISSPNSLMFGPLPTDGTISHLQAVTTNGVAGQTVTVLNNTTPTQLACTTAGALDRCSNDADSVLIQAGNFLQVAVVNGAGSWRVTFQLR
jgi:hypothetical protein